jgi:hypothetical protein
MTLNDREITRLAGEGMIAPYAEAMDTICAKHYGAAWEAFE